MNLAGEALAEDDLEQARQLVERYTVGPGEEQVHPTASETC